MAAGQGCLALKAILPLIWELRFNEEVNWENIYQSLFENGTGLSYLSDGPLIHFKDETKCENQFFLSWL